MYSTQKKDKQKQKKQTKYKIKKKKLKNFFEKKPLLLDEVCWCCCKFLHPQKRVGEEYQLTRQSSKATKQQWGGGHEVPKKGE
jgi:hypothetical protein